MKTNRYRSLSYQWVKLGNNFKRYFEFRYLTRIWKKNFKEYLESLKSIPIYKNSEPSSVPLINNHAMRELEILDSKSNSN